MVQSVIRVDAAFATYTSIITVFFRFIMAVFVWLIVNPCVVARSVANGAAKQIVFFKYSYFFASIIPIHSAVTFDFPIFPLTDIVPIYAGRIGRFKNTKTVRNAIHGFARIGSLANHVREFKNIIHFGDKL